MLLIADEELGEGKGLAKVVPEGVSVIGRGVGKGESLKYI